MDFTGKPKYRCITVSGKIATGTTTLSKNLAKILNWQYINVGGIQRIYDRENKIHENMRGAHARSDKHELSIEEMTKRILLKDKNIVYEAWLSGFVARDIKDVLRILLICSHDDLRVDRVVNRENITVSEAKKWIKQRESENISKWKKLYGDYDFWDKKYYNLIIDTYSSGPMQTVGKVLDALTK